jgi:hypothetical protein
MVDSTSVWKTLNEVFFWGGWILGLIVCAGIAIGILYYFLVVKRRRKWHIEIHEQKKDGRIHSIGRDILMERTKDWGTKTLYFLKNRKKVALPPPDHLVDRIKAGQEEVDYLQIERQLFPTEKSLQADYHNPEVNKRVQEIYDKEMQDIEQLKTKDKIQDRYMYIPINKVLVANMEFKPIPYDVQLTAQRQVKIAEEFFKQKESFWDKWGSAITLGTVAIIVILVVILSFNFINGVIEMTLDKVDSVAQPLSQIAQNIGNKPIA